MKIQLHDKDEGLNVGLNGFNLLYFSLMIKIKSHKLCKLFKFLSVHTQTCILYTYIFYICIFHLRLG